MPASFSTLRIFTELESQHEELDVHAVCTIAVFHLHWLVGMHEYIGKD